jgi:hypothetical protein
MKLSQVFMSQSFSNCIVPKHQCSLAAEEQANCTTTALAQIIDEGIICFKLLLSHSENTFNE